MYSFLHLQDCPGSSSDISSHCIVKLRCCARPWIHLSVHLILHRVIMGLEHMPAVNGQEAEYTSTGRKSLQIGCLRLMPRLLEGWKKLQCQYVSNCFFMYQSGPTENVIVKPPWRTVLQLRYKSSLAHKVFFQMLSSLLCSIWLQKVM